MNSTAIHNLYKFLDVLKAQELTLPAVQTFLLIAMYPGIEHSKIRQQLQADNSVVARATGILGSTPPEGRGHHPEGLNWIRTEKDPSDRRVNKSWLTNKGEKVLTELFEPLQSISKVKK